jgi:hypothetical protein
LNFDLIKVSGLKVAGKIYDIVSIDDNEMRCAVAPPPAAVPRGNRVTQAGGQRQIRAGRGGGLALQNLYHRRDLLEIHGGHELLRPLTEGLGVPQGVRDVTSAAKVAVNTIMNTTTFQISFRVFTAMAFYDHHRCVCAASDAAIPATDFRLAGTRFGLTKTAAWSIKTTAPR